MGQGRRQIPLEAEAKEWLAKNATIKEYTLKELMFWIILTVIVQLSWGLYGVCTRYLQTTSEYPVPTLQLMVVLNIIAWPGLILFCTIPTYVMEWWKKRQKKKNSAGRDEEVDDDETKEEPMTRKERFKKWLKTTSLATGIGAMVSMQALTQVYASKFANAYIAQLIFMFTPAFAAVANRVVLKQASPPFLWTTIVLSLGASVMVIAGQLQEDASGEGNNNPSTGDLFLGIGLALCSTLLLTIYLILIQVTRHLVSGEAVLWGKRNVAMILFVPLALGIEGTDWSWVANLDGKAWGVLIFAGLYIYTLMNIFLQFCTRALGALMVSIFLSLRLVASIVGSIVLLNETPTKALTWVGFVLIMIVMTAFIGIQYYQKKRAQVKALAENFVETCDDEEVHMIAEIESTATTKQETMFPTLSGMIQEDDHCLSGMLSGLDHRRCSAAITRPHTVKIFNRWEIDYSHRATKSCTSLIDGLGHSLNEGGFAWKESDSEEEEFEMHIEKKWSYVGNEVPVFHPIPHHEK